MPYNTAPITPPATHTGSTHLPLARVKKIVHADDDVHACSNNAVFAIAVATEMFIFYMAEQAYNVVKSERRPRKNIQYKDIAHAVARIDNLEFLSDVVPQTTTYKVYAEAKDRKAKTNATKDAPVLGNGQRTMEQMSERPDVDMHMDDIPSILMDEEEVARADALQNGNLHHGSKHGEADRDTYEPQHHHNGTMRNDYGMQE